MVAQAMPAVGAARRKRALCSSAPSECWCAPCRRLRYQLMRGGTCGADGFGRAHRRRDCGGHPAAAGTPVGPGAANRVGKSGPQLTRRRPQPQQSPQQFAAALPTRAQVPALLGVVLVQATDAGVEPGPGQVRLQSGDRQPPGALHLRISGQGGLRQHPHLHRQIADRDSGAGLDKLHVERKNVGDTIVSADVGFVIYLRGA